MTGEEGPAHLVGRGEVVAALHRRLGDVRAGFGAVTLLVGETGVGKSTLIAQFVQEIRARGVRVLIGRAPPLDDPPPFSLLQSAIESAPDDPLLRSDANPLMGGDRPLIGFIPRLGEAEFRTPVGIDRRLLEVLGGDEAGATRTREELLTGISERLLELTRHGSTVLVLEDLHRADRSSLAALEFFAKELKNRPLWILATARPAAALSSTGRARLEAFEATTRAEGVVLRPMTSEETGEYLRRNDPLRELSADEIARRYSESGGNPYLLQQLDHRKPLADEDPAQLTSRDSPLDEERRQILDVAAVLGPEFSFALLLSASEVDEERLAEAVDGLVARGLLFERPGELFGFSEDRSREEVYVALPERRRRHLHRRAGEALEAMGAADPARVYALARHFYLGRETGKAVRYNRLAADLAERALAPDAAWEYLSHALECQRERAPDDLDTEAELVLGLARIMEELGVLQESEEVLRDFFERERGDPRLSSGRRAALEIFLCRVLTSQGKLPPAAELAKKVLDTPGLEKQPLVPIGAHHQLGLVFYYEGRYPEAVAQHTEEIRLARSVGNPLILARAQIWRVAALAMLGQTEQAIAEAREVTAARDRLGSVRESAQAHLFLGDILADARSPPSDRKDAIGEYRKAIRFAEQAKDPRRIGWAFYKITELLREEGRFDEATESVERACHILAQVGDQVGLSVSIKVRGQIAMDRGELDRAEADFLEALHLLHGTDHTTEEIDVVLRLAQLRLARQDPASAQEEVVHLERMDLPRVRPDLLIEFRALQEALAAARTGNPPGVG